jgi:hypothetical protein
MKNALKFIVNCEDFKVYDHLKVFVLVVPFPRLANVPLPMKR